METKGKWMRRKTTNDYNGSYEELYSRVQNKMAAARKYVAIAEWTMWIARSTVQIKRTFFHKSIVLKG